MIRELSHIRGIAGDNIFSALNIPITDKETTFSGAVFNLYWHPILEEDYAWFGPVSFYCSGQRLFISFGPD